MSLLFLRLLLLLLLFLLLLILVLFPRHLLRLLFLHFLFMLFLFFLILIVRSISILVQIFVLRTRTFHETLGISAAYQGVAICTYVSTHDAVVRVRGMSASEKARAQRSIFQPASSSSHMWNSSGRKALVG